MKLALLSLFLLGASANVFSFHRNYIAQFSKVTGEKATATQDECPTYSCASLPVGECVQYNATNNSYNLHSCLAGQFCPVALDSESNENCLTLPPSSQSFGYPGDTCTKNSDCSGLAQNCTKGICYGFGVDHSCSDQPDCGVGLMCENVGTNGTCQFQIPPGKACKTWVYDMNCINGDVCNNEVCVPMYSQPNGAIVSTDYGVESCASGFYESFIGFPEEGMCAPAPVSPVAEFPIPCQPGTPCYSADGRWSIPCQCGVNAQGSAFCPVFPGDDLYQNFLTLMKQYVNQSNPALCHILNFGEEACGAPQTLFTALNKAKVTVDYQVAIQDNTDCIKNTFTSAYWSLMQSEEELSLD